MANDQYGRSVIKHVVGSNDIYVVVENDVASIVIKVPVGTAQEKVYDTINSMAPAE